MMHYNNKKGFALPAMIFLMVVVTLLIGYMARIQSSQAAVSGLRIQSTRVFWAAKAGTEWAAFQLINNPSCAAATGSLTINGFQVSVSCNSNSYTEGGSTVFMFEITALAQNAVPVDSLDYVSRQVTTVLHVEI